MSGIRQETDDTGKMLRPPITEAVAAHGDEHEDAEDSTTLKFDGPVQVSDDDAGSDPYNRTGKFQRLIRS